MTAKPDKWQSYANLSNPCEYLPNSDRKGVTMPEYNKIMSQIIGKNMDIDKTLIALLDEANKYVISATTATNSKKVAKYVITSTNRKVIGKGKSLIVKSKRRKNEQKATKTAKRVRK
jgi:hypothetical protein